MVALLPSVSAICLALLPAFGGTLPPGATAAEAAIDLPAGFARDGAQVQFVTFANAGLGAVKVVRGEAQQSSPAASAPRRGTLWDRLRSVAIQSVQTVTFHGPSTSAVRVMRGSALGLPRDDLAMALAGPQAAMQAGDRIEKVRFANSGLSPVTVVRGQPEAFDMALFGPPRGFDLDLVAFAVDGLESGHGSNPAMWRPGLAGPQGPMQVSEAAAFDVGGGDRFNLEENRALGRAYLAHLYRRYGDWPDAVAAYNWGPGNVDSWILAGRPGGRLPIEVQRYVVRALSDALLVGEGAMRSIR